MEVHILNGNAMHQCLGLGQTAEDAAGLLLHRIGEGTAGNHGVNAGVVPVGMVVIDRHIEFQG